MPKFQFKHCTIIRIAIDCGYALAVQFQFKHCTIIREAGFIYHSRVTIISIQALYDYK